MKARYVNVYKLMEFANNMKDKTIDANDIARFPWADVRENVHGKWIIDEKRFGNAEHHCNLCGAILKGDEWKWRNNYFCYHCGAVIDEWEEECEKQQ